MAPLPVIANTYRCAFNWMRTDSDRTATNVMHFVKSGSTPAALWTSLNSHVTAAMRDHTGPSSVINEVVITPLDGTSVSLPQPTGGGTGWHGNLSDVDYIPQAACLVKLVTAFRGRSQRGRVYLPWVTENSQSNGTFDPTNRAAMDSAWTAFVAAMTGDGFVLSVASYKLAIAHPVVAIGIETDIATIRRRNTRVSSA